MTGKKIVGWNIFFELEDEEGNLSLEAWDISNYIANLIDEDFEEVWKEQYQSFEAPTGYTEQGPRPFYGNPRKLALDRWGNRRYIRRRKDGTYMKNVDVARSLRQDRLRDSNTWAPKGYRDQGDGSPSLLTRLLDMFSGVEEEVLMAEANLMSAETNDYYPWVADSESEAYIYAYNDGHADGRATTVIYSPLASDREVNDFRKIFKQKAEEEVNWEDEFGEDTELELPTNPTPEQNELLDAFVGYEYYDPHHHDDVVMRGLSIVEDDNFLKLYDACLSHDGIIDGSHPAEAYIIAIDCYRALYDQTE